MSGQNVFKRWESWWFGCLLAVVVLALYAPAVRFGLIWDDPIGYHRAVGQSLWGIWAGSPTYPFYRPLAVLLNRQLVSPSGVVNAPLAHMIQIGAHLIIALVSVPVLQALGFYRWHARLTALLFAAGPFAFEAVAWQAPMQPLAMMWVLLALLVASRFVQRRQVIWLGLSLMAFAVALFFQEGVLLFVFAFFWLAARGKPVSLRRGGWSCLPLLWGWPVWHLGVAVAYLLVWLNAPRQIGVTRPMFQIESSAYLVQGVVFPVSRLVAGWVTQWPSIWLLGLFATVAALLVFGAWRLGAAGATWLCCAWIVAGILPVWAGLSWEHIRTGARLLYPASLGIAGLWAGWAIGLCSHKAQWRRVLGGLMLAVVLAVSLEQWSQFQKLYQKGSQHLDHAVEVLAAAPGQRLLFVNFPDRLEIRPPLYPLGFWGLHLAPVVQDLSDYALAEKGQSAESRSLSAFLVGAGERGTGPYHVDMRGEDTGPDVLFQATRRSDAVYLTQYRPDGTLALEEVGRVRPTQSSARSLASLGDSAQIVSADAHVSTSRVLTLRLVWRCLKPLREHDTIFVHFWKDGSFRGGADGDSLGGLVPLFVWEPGTEIVDVRHVDVARFEAGHYQVQVGIYNRLSGVRYPAWADNQHRFPDDEVPALILTLPGK